MSALFSERGAHMKVSILTDERVQDFINTHADALNRGMTRVEMSDGMRQRLERSNWVFSGMKTFHELNEAFPSLIDERGERKTFDRFYDDVRKIHETYNRNYLRAEYNFITQSAEMASRWERFSEDGDRYNLQYRTAGDDRVRPEHAAMEGITLPIDDPFWEAYFPPNGWNCRCTVVQVRKSKHPTTPSDEAIALGEAATQKDTKGMFRFNPGKQRKSVPDYNPYTISKCKTCNKGKLFLEGFIPPSQLCQACEIVQQCAGDRTKSQTAIERTHYMHEMKPLLSRSVEKTIEGRRLSVGFTKRGNKHLFFDTFDRTRIVRKEDLKNLATYLENAEYVGDSALTHPRTDNIEHFYYFKVQVNGRWVRLNVAKEVKQRPNGFERVSHYVYSINDIIE